MQIAKGGHQIRTVTDWYTYAPPKGKERHWKPGRSAYELAAAWCGRNDCPAVPSEIAALLASHRDTQQLELIAGTPEHRIPFDDLPGEPRNADLVLSARDDRGAAGITIEAKADEPYGERVVDALAVVVQKIASDQNSNGVARIQKLAASLLGPHEPGLPHLGELRYQLLTATAGTLAYARHLSADRAILVIHEFVTHLTSDKRHTENGNDLDAFLRRVTRGAIAHLSPGVLLGPLTVPGPPLFLEVPRLYVGKVVRILKYEEPYESEDFIKELIDDFVPPSEKEQPEQEKTSNPPPAP